METKATFRFRPLIIAIFLLLMVPAFAALLYSVYATNERLANSMTASLSERFKFETILAVTNLVEPARKDADTTATLGNLRPGFFNGDGGLPYLKSVLDQQESYLAVYAGHQDGSFRLAKRGVAGTQVPGWTPTDDMQFELRWMSASSSVENFIFLDGAGGTLATASTPTQYDPRVRPWYREAASNGKPIVTDPYVFSFTGFPGITVATPFFANGALAGAVGIDISLEVISDFLESRAISGRTVSVVYESSGLVIASSDRRDVSRAGSPRLELGSVQSLTSNLPALALSLRSTNEQDSLIFRHPDTGDQYVAVFSDIALVPGKQWSLVAITPTEDFKGEVEKNNLLILGFGGALIVLQMILIYAFARMASQPLELATESIEHLIRLDADEVRVRETKIHEIASLSSAIRKLAATIAAFTLYVPRDLVNQLLRSGKRLEVGVESRHLTIFFSDLAGFSSLSEVTPIRELLSRVSAYFEVVTGAIREERGTVDKFIGDGVMAFWGAPQADESHAYHACVAALKSQKRMKGLNARLAQEGKPPLSVRIGIHCDAVLVGNIGTAERLSYTLIGDGVNVASRLEAVNKDYGTQICASHDVFMEAGERLWMRPIDKVVVKGRAGDLIIYELMGTRDGPEETQPTEVQRQVCLLSEKAFPLFLKGQYGEALSAYEQILQVAEDPVARAMTAKCRGLLASPA